MDDAIGSKLTIVLSLVGLILAGATMLVVASEPLFWTAGLALDAFSGGVGGVTSRREVPGLGLFTGDARSQVLSVAGFDSGSVFLMSRMPGSGGRSLSRAALAWVLKAGSVPSSRYFPYAFSASAFLPALA